ncbi:TIGR01440 family protein [Paenibacillus lutrae]|uniref:UPF0340 protein EDM21_18520 n=1 Tax=Paenibacillus lutrae TaxID=2078573 RepID=A0A7X3FL41_9BACL|nr:TIGR01440 family protein [Paenibacillus lutrae]MVP01489.1 TIGR01440 family protein [Paenibacillus lutrae]
MSTEQQKMLDGIGPAVETNFRALIEAGGLRSGQIVVIGTSTSEVRGERIGTSGIPEAAERIYAAAARVAAEHGLWLAFQCCEHLNRALVIEEALLEKLPSLEEVRVVPVPKAGGSMAAHAYRHMTSPCVVEEITAHAGIDIGDTLIGMHLRRVAVPLRPPVPRVGEAHVTMAYTRPKLIGGPRAVYELFSEGNDSGKTESSSKTYSYATKDSDACE